MPTRLTRLVACALILTAAGCGGGGGGGGGGASAGAGGGGGGGAQGGSGACTAGTFECETIDLINAERAAQGLPALAFDVDLHDAAVFHNEWMVANDCFSHACAGEPDLGARMAAAGYPATSAGECIAAGYMTPAAVVAGWMNSPGHRAILLGDFEEVAIAHAECPSGCGYGVYWTAAFGSR